MLLGLRTIIYPTTDLAALKDWYTGVLGFGPYFDEPYYVGFDVGGYELALQPAAEPGRTPVTYWGVPDADAALAALLAKGAVAESGVDDVGGGIRVATVRDPAGNAFGIIQNPHFKAAGEAAAPGQGQGR